jgi:hypothetical protein
LSTLFALIINLFVAHVLRCLICKIQCVCIAGSPTRQSGRLFQFVPTLQLPARHATGRHRDCGGVRTVFAVSAVLLSSLFCLYLASLFTLACFDSLFFVQSEGTRNFYSSIERQVSANYLETAVATDSTVICQVTILRVLWIFWRRQDSYFADNQPKRVKLLN